MGTKWFEYALCLKFEIKNMLTSLEFTSVIFTQHENFIYSRYPLDHRFGLISGLDHKRKPEFVKVVFAIVDQKFFATEHPPRGPDKTSVGVMTTHIRSRLALLVDELAVALVLLKVE